MLIASIIFTVLAIAGGLLAVMGNMMSDSPSTPFQGASLFWTPAIIAVVCFGLWLGGYHLNIISR